MSQDGKDNSGVKSIQLIIKSRVAKIGDDFSVQRVLPFRAKRMVGPFCFLDHMGPHTLKVSKNADVLAHPHIGLSTLTYLFSGRILHKDSIGSVQEIKAGEVNWMTAGKGISHAELIPNEFIQQDPVLHGLQAWIALPKDKEECEPRFEHYSISDIPVLNKDGVELTVIAGSILGLESKVRISSPLLYIKIAADKNSNFVLPKGTFELALYVVQGSVGIGEEILTAGQMGVLDSTNEIDIKHTEPALYVIFGGESFPEPRYIDWNLVSSDKEILQRSKKMWVDKTFPMVPGEVKFVPWPD